MPAAKRTKPSSKTATAAAAAPKKRASKLAKANDITADQEAEIREAFDLFSIRDPDAPPEAPKKKTSDESANVIRTSDVRRCLVALDAYVPSTTSPAEIKDTLDPAGLGRVSFEAFFSYAALKLNERAHTREADGDEYDEDENEIDHEAERAAMVEQVSEAFGLFTRDAGGVIRLEHLRRVAKELREDVPESTLRDMIKEANGGSTSGIVTMDEFERVMQRAGVFG